MPIQTPHARSEAGPAGPRRPRPAHPSGVARAGATASRSIGVGRGWPPLPPSQGATLHGSSCPVISSLGALSSIGRSYQITIDAGPDGDAAPHAARLDLTYEGDGTSASLRDLLRRSDGSTVGARCRARAKRRLRRLVPVGPTGRGRADSGHIPPGRARRGRVRRRRLHGAHARERSALGRHAHSLRQPSERRHGAETPGLPGTTTTSHHHQRPIDFRAGSWRTRGSVRRTHGDRRLNVAGPVRAKARGEDAYALEVIRHVRHRAQLEGRPRGD